MELVPLCFIPFIFYKSKQWNLIIYHSIPPHPINPNRP